MRFSLAQASEVVSDMGGEIDKVSPYVQNIASKVGVIKDLESRLSIMQGLDPLMDGILDKMSQVTDHSNLERI